MQIKRTDWDPYSPPHWAELLGLVNVPLFGTQSPLVVAPGKHSLLLDGAKASFALSSSEEDGLYTGMEPLSWSWSSRVRHTVVLNPRREKMFVRRWDEPDTIRQFKVPTMKGAQELLQQLQASRPPKASDVIERVMQAFRAIRQTLSEPVASLKVLNALLLVAREIALHPARAPEAKKAMSVDDAISVLPSPLRDATGVTDLSASDRRSRIDGILDYLIDADPNSSRRLHADLLFRHAASQLYQEAHFELERTRQMYFLGQAPAAENRGPRDARYTPTNLARALVQQALDRLPALSKRGGLIRVLDPACGSAVFLQECLREVAARPNPIGKLKLLGYDTSAISKAVSDSCLTLGAAELPTNLKVHWQIEQVDALTNDWPVSDLILMNPPFQSWQDMSSQEQSHVSRVLGDLAQGRPDKALAFIWKAFKALEFGGVLAAVLPGALLDNRSGVELRKALSAESELLVVGRFEGFSYFASSLVETAFLILRRKLPVSAAPPLRVLIAAEGAEDTALRVLRGAEIWQTEEAEEQPVELFDVKPESFRPGSWLPRRSRDLRLLETLDTLSLPKVSDLFNVHQGVRTGSKTAFVLSEAELETLPRTERKFFRRAAGQGTIKQGVLLSGEYVFYPYAPEGAIIRTESELLKQVPVYHERWLVPHKNVLVKRPKIAEWWLPTWPRNWQFAAGRKLVSTYFGGPGSFAYDDQGDFVVLEGFAWLWVRGLQNEGGDEEEIIEFEDTRLPFAYIALLNSRIFARVLSCFSWRLQGGQMRLEPKFLNSVPLPDLSDVDRIPRRLLDRLDLLGRRIRKAELDDVDVDVDRAAAAAYGLPLSNT